MSNSDKSQYLQDFERIGHALCRADLNEWERGFLTAMRGKMARGDLLNNIQRDKVAKIADRI